LNHFTPSKPNCKSPSTAAGECARHDKTVSSQNYYLSQAVRLKNDPILSFCSTTKSQKGTEGWYWLQILMTDRLYHPLSEKADYRIGFLWFKSEI
jgi:hypothetical protein